MYGYHFLFCFLLGLLDLISPEVDKLKLDKKKSEHFHCKKNRKEKYLGFVQYTDIVIQSFLNSFLSIFVSWLLLKLKIKINLGKSV